MSAIAKVQATSRNELAITAFRWWVERNFPGSHVWIRWQWRNWGKPPRTWFEIEVS